MAGWRWVRPTSLQPKRPERHRQRDSLGLCTEYRVLHVKPHIDGDLVVAAAARVYLLAEVAKLFGEHTLHSHVDVLVLDPDLERALFGKRGDAPKFASNLGRLRLRHHGTPKPLHLGQHRHMRGGSHAVPLRKREIEYGVFAHRVCKYVGIDRPVCYRLLHGYFPVLYKIHAEEVKGAFRNSCFTANARHLAQTVSRQTP